jgi:xanthine/uracil/vitamin C permease (AzgA family)
LNRSIDRERLIERYFHLAENQATIRQEVLGGLITFPTMAYIVVVSRAINALLWILTVLFVLRYVYVATA